MDKEKKELARAFSVKDEVEGFLDNLQKLKIEGSIEQDQYVSIKVEYEQRLRTAAVDIEKIRKDLKQRLKDQQGDLKDCKSELGKLEIKHKVGELSQKEYQNATQELRARFEQLEADTEELQGLVAAKSSEEVSQVKGLLEKRQGARQREIASYELELDKVEVKYKVGELSLDEYRSRSKELRTRIRAIQAAVEEVEEPVEEEEPASVDVVVEEPVITVAEVASSPEVAVPAQELEQAEVATPEFVADSGVSFSVKGLLTPWTRIAAMVIGLLLLISVFLPWIGASELLGTGLGTDSTMDISPLITTVGIVGGLVVLGTAFLRTSRTRGKAQIIVGILAFVALLAIVLIGVLPLLDGYARTLMVVEGGLYLYIVAAVMLIINGKLERRHQ